MNPLQAVLAERQRPEERRRDRHRMYGGADVVDEAGKGQRGGTRSAADDVGAFNDQHPTTFPRNRDCRGQSVWPGADDDRVVLAAIRRVR